MTGSDLKILTENILDNSVTFDEDFFYQLLNIAKNKLEGQRLWQFLKKSDASNQASSSPITLPTDLSEEYKVMVGVDREYLPVPFEDKYIQRNSSGRYYIDWAALTLNLLGATIPSGTLYLFYKRFTPDIAAGTSPVFPERFHPILAYHVAAYYQAGVDSDDIFARMSPVNKQAALELQRSMENWDSSLAMRAQDNTIGVANSNSGIPLGEM